MHEGCEGAKCIYLMRNLVLVITNTENSVEDIQTAVGITHNTIASSRKFVDISRNCLKEDAS